MTADNPRLRLGILGIVAVSLFATLFARLWYLQVMAAPEFRVAARANQQRVIVEEAPRGRILDRAGRIIVDNRISTVVTVDRTKLAKLNDDDRARVVVRLAEELTRYGVVTTVDDVENRLEDVRFSPYTPVPVGEDVPEDLAVYLIEHRAEFTDAISVVSRAVRNYPFGRLASHVLGYVGPANDEELAAHQRSVKPYQLGDEIGKSGVERIYEDDLRGRPGRRVLEVDAQGNTIRELSYDEPVAGDDVQLTVDVNVQGVTEQALREELEKTRKRPVENGPPNPAPAGSVVVLDPNNGSLIAMASFPDYDPSSFVNGIDSTEWGALQDPANHAPLNNRAIQGQYAPGSTFKPVTAFAGLRSGAITPNTTINDPGFFRLDRCTGETCTFRNAGSRPYGAVNLRKALTVSSDVYFYRLGSQFWFGREQFGDAIQQAATDLGLGEDTGVPLPFEKSGFIPTPDKKKARHDANPDAFPEGRWFAGDNVNIAIGQGDVLVTPLQLANVYATIANGGHVFAPNVAARILKGGTPEVVREIQPRERRALPITPEQRQPIIDGLVGATRSDGGTARATFAGFPNWTVAGKTGTAEVARKTDTAVFAAFAPAEAPQYVAVAVMEESGFGGVAAAPLVRRILVPLADPAQMPTVGPGGVLSAPVPESVDPQSDGEVID